MSGLGWFLVRSAAAIQPVERDERVVYLDALDRRAIEANLDELPEGVGAVLAEREGEPFLVRLATDAWRAGEEGDVEAVLSELLPRIGLGEALASLVSLGRTEEPLVEAGALEAELESRHEALYGPFVEAAGEPTPDTVEEITVMTLETAERLLAERTSWAFEQHVEGVPIEGAGVQVLVESGTVRVIEGALFVDLSVANSPNLGPYDAEDLAVGAAGGKALGSSPVVVADGAELRHAWRVVVEDEGLQTLVWIDAESGEIAQFLPQFLPIAGRGTVLDLAPGGTTSIATFDVNPSINGRYNLNDNFTETIVNLGADGTAMAILTSSNTNLADFAVAPFDATTNLTNMTTASYNGLFQQVNAKGIVRRVHQRFREFGSRPIPPHTVVVNTVLTCGSADPDNACGGGRRIELGIGSRTFGANAGLNNTALDATVIAHELGHTLHQEQRLGVNGLPVGVMNASLDEGLADYWARAVTGAAIVANFAGNSATPSESGSVPRIGDAGDVFPEHMALFGGNNELHANGEIIAFAMASARAELGRRSSLGPFMLDNHLMGALSAVGIGQSAAQTEVAIHDAYRRLLIGLVGRAGNTLDAQDIVVGFARAGITASQREAIVSIDLDFISTTQTTPPVFTIWTGRDYLFAPPLDIALPGTFHNVAYSVEVANDAAFTVNAVGSGSRFMPVISLSGLPTDTWSPDQKDWDQLRAGGTRLYYRVASTDGNGAQLRTSDRFNAQSIALPVAYAVLNAPSGGGGCSTGPRGGIGAAGLLALLIARRRVVPSIGARSDDEGR